MFGPTVILSDGISAIPRLYCKTLADQQQSGPSEVGTTSAHVEAVTVDSPE